MTVIFSKKCEIGLQSVLFLSTEDFGKIFNAQTISNKVKQPKEFVSKVLQELTKSGIVGSNKGKNGGFYLARPADEIKLYEIVHAIDKDSVFNNCVLGFPGCSDDKPCPVHSTWGRIRNEARDMLMEESLSEFRDKTVEKLGTL